MKISDLLKRDIGEVMKLDKKELSKITTVLGSAVNKRIKRLEKSGIESRPLKSINRSGGKITTKGKNINQLRAEYARAVKFLESKTSTVKGYKKSMKEFGKKIGVDLSQSDYNILMDSLSKLEETEAGFIQLYGFYKTLSDMEQVIKENPNFDTGEIALEMRNKITEEYEKAESKFLEKEDAYDMSKFFKFRE